LFAKKTQSGSKLEIMRKTNKAVEKKLQKKRHKKTMAKRKRAKVIARKSNLDKPQFFGQTNPERVLKAPQTVAEAPVSSTDSLPSTPTKPEPPQDTIAAQTEPSSASRDS